MKIPVMAALVLGCVFVQPSMAQTNCTEAFTACQKPQDGNRCDVVCKTYCAKEKKVCLKTGTFRSKNNHWTALEKK